MSVCRKHGAKASTQTKPKKKSGWSIVSASGKKPKPVSGGFKLVSASGSKKRTGAGFQLISASGHKKTASTPKCASAGQGPGQSRL